MTLLALTLLALSAAEGCMQVSFCFLLTSFFFFLTLMPDDCFHLTVYCMCGGAARCAGQLWTARDRLVGVLVYAYG